MKKPIRPLLWVLILVISISLVAVFSSGGCRRVEEVVEEFVEEEVEEPGVEKPVKEPVVEEEIDSNDTSAYEAFIENNSQYARPISEEELQLQIDEAINYLNRNPSGKHADDLRQTIIEKLNIGMLIEGLEEGELIVTTTAIDEQSDFTEKRLLFTDPQVGTFPVLLLIPNSGKSPYPAVIGLHGHGDSPDVFRDNFFGKDLVKEGFVVIMPTLRAMYLDDIEKEISKKMLLNGFTLMGMRVYETMLLIKYLNSLDFVDDTRIGIIGHSGGSETASLVSRVSTNLRGGIYDFHSTLLDFGAPDDPHDHYHCQVVPSLSYYMPFVNDYSTLPFPNQSFDYKYPEENDRQEVIDFFNTNLGSKNLKRTLNVIEKTDFSLSPEINRNNLSDYRDFIKKNQQHKREILDTPLSEQLDEARRYLELHPAGKHTDDLRAKIIEELNIGFLLEGIEERELIVTTVGINEYKEYTEKELLFKDPLVGTFFVLLLIPNQQKEEYPAIVGLHGHGDSAFDFRDAYFGKDLAQEGFVVIMLSFRAMDADNTEATISEELLSNGFTLIGLRLYETLLLIKYLNYADFIDDSRIGVIGHSGGSHTAHLVSRISDDLKAGVYDYDSYMLDMCETRIHCQTVPRLAYYDPQINDHSTFTFPTRMFDYGYPGENDKAKVIVFFKEHLMNE